MTPFTLGFHMSPLPGTQHGTYDNIFGFHVDNPQPNRTKCTKVISVPGHGLHMIRLFVIILLITILETTIATNTSDLSNDTISRLCHAQCVAECVDSETDSCPCPLTCGNLTASQEVTDVASVGELSVTYASPYIANVTWTLSPSHHGHVSYVGEIRIGDTSSWAFWTETNKTDHTVKVNHCTDTEVRVVAVSRYGWNDFQYTEIPRGPRATAAPGAPQNIRAAFEHYREGVNLHAGFMWDRPEGWTNEDISRYQVPSQISKSCANNRLPPIPIVITQMFANGSGQAVFRVDESGFMCSYSSEVRAVSVCDVQGDPAPLIVNFTDCEAIRGFECPEEELTPPGVVEQADVLGVSDPENELLVVVHWEPPQELGYKGYVDYYLLLWAPMVQSLPIPDIDRDRAETISVNGNITTANITLEDYGVEYGIKIIAQALDQEGRPIIPDDNIHMRRVLDTVEVDSTEGD